MAGLDLPAKLRRSLGSGEVLEASEIARRLGEHDEDGDGRLTKVELGRFLTHAGLGGPWFSEMFASTVWRKAQNALDDDDVAALDLKLLARVLHFAMARTRTPARRYVISPEAFRGEAPRLDRAETPVDEVAPDVRRASVRGPSAKGGTVRRPAGPSASRPGAQGASRPGAPGASRPGPPGASRPGAPGASRPGVQGVSRPGPQAVSRPSPRGAPVRSPTAGPGPAPGGALPRSRGPGPQKPAPEPTAPRRAPVPRTPAPGRGPAPRGRPVARGGGRRPSGRPRS